MANWASTNYVIVGNKDSLQKIYAAISNHTLLKDSSDDWEGNVLFTLGISENKFSGRHLRGFIQDTDFNGESLTIYAEEAWGVTEFKDFLKELFDDIEVFWETEEPGMEIYQTNDSTGEFFPERFCIDACVDGDWQTEYFTTKENVYKWLSEIANCSTEEDVKQFNEANKDGESFIHVHKFEVVED